MSTLLTTPCSTFSFYLLLILGGGFLLYGAFCAFHDFWYFILGEDEE